MSGGIDIGLELMNGNWSLLSFFAMVFIGYHLLDVTARRRVTLRQWLTDLPQSMQLAVALFTISLGIFLSRAPVWYWRFTTGGDPAHLSDIKELLFLGGVCGCLGVICAVRVVTRPMLSHWPWIAALLTGLVYTTMTLAFRA